MNLKDNLTSKGLQGSIGKSRMQGILGTNPAAIPISVDNALSLSSTNPVQNRVITAAITNRLWSDEVKDALLQIVEKVAYVDEHGQDYYDALYDALYPPVGLDSIGAVFDSTATIYNTDTLDDLKQYLTVTAYYTGGTSETVTTYTLSGSMDAGTQTITVAYGGKTTTFTVTVVEWVTSISAVFTQGSAVIYDTDSLDTLKQYLVVTATFVDSSTMTVTDYTLSGTLAVGTNTITVGYAGKTTTFSVTAADSGWDYYWDFTESLVDRVAGETAALTNLTRGASGITFAGSDAVRYIKLTDVFAPGKYVEIDLKEVNNIYEDFGNTASIVLFGDTWPWVNSVANGFGYHYSTSTSMNRFGFISSDSTHWGYSSISDSRGGPAYFDGNHTLKIAVNSSNEVSVFRDNEDMRIEYGGSPQTITDCNSIWIGMPSTTSSYMSFANMTVTGVRIRDLEVS